MKFFTCFNVPKVKGNTSTNSTTDMLDTELLIALNDTLALHGLYVSRFDNNNGRLTNILQSIPTEVCNNEYLNEILESPVVSKTSESVLLLVSQKTNAQGNSKIIAMCFYEVSKNNCTLHLVCNIHHSDQIKVGEQLIKFVIDSVRSKVKTMSLVAKTEQNLSRLVEYYKKFGFSELAESCIYDGIAKQRLQLRFNSNNQSGGITKDFIKYNNRKYLVRTDDKKKKYIISKGSHIYMSTIKYTKC
jgi:predicted GNAT family N-acyltransferase